MPGEPEGRIKCCAMPGGITKLKKNIVRFILSNLDIFN